MVPEPDTCNRKPLFALRIRTSCSFGDIVQTGFQALGVASALWSDETNDRAVCEQYFSDRESAGTGIAVTRRCLEEWAADDEWEIEIGHLPAQDWQESWKRFFKAERVSRRVIVRPSWDTAPSGDGDCIVEIDPAMSFGTGTHPTTRACIAFLDRYTHDRRGGSLLDAGCGSGILSIAAAMLGFDHIMAVDHDPIAVADTRANAARNGVADAIICRQQLVSQLGDLGTFDVTVANMLSGILKDHAESLAGCVADSPDARLFLSGILDRQAEDVGAVFLAQGLRILSSPSTEGWTHLEMGK